MQDPPALRGNLLLGQKAAVGFTRTNLVGGHQTGSEQILHLLLDGGGSAERHICCFSFFKEPGSMGGALLC